MAYLRYLTHFGHKNIVKYSDRPITHEVMMLSNWIDCVAPEDQILHLGDVSLFSKGTAKRWMKVIKLLPGEKFLIKGNHDHFPDSLYEEAGFTIIRPFTIESSTGVVAITHRPITPEYPFFGILARMRVMDDPEWQINIHGHCHGTIKNKEHDGTFCPNKIYIDISVECTDYSPVRLGNIYPIKNVRKEEVDNIISV